MLKKLVLVGTLLYTGTLAVLSLVHLKKVPSLGVSFADKIYHFGAYFVLATLWFATFYCSFKFDIRKAVLSAFGFSVIFGTIIEVFQGTLTSYRNLDVYDVLANTFGALLACILVSLMKKMQVKNE